jgi:hypothetical protein
MPDMMLISMNDCKECGYDYKQAKSERSWMLLGIYGGVDEIRQRREREMKKMRERAESEPISKRLVAVVVYVCFSCCVFFVLSL